MINEIIDIVLEAEGEAKTLESSEIVSNALLQQNVHRLHKQVFVKVKVGDNPSDSTTDAASSKSSFKSRKSQPVFGKKRDPHTSKTFR